MVFLGDEDYGQFRAEVVSTLQPRCRIKHYHRIVANCGVSASRQQHVFGHVVHQASPSIFVLRIHVSWLNCKMGCYHSQAARSRNSYSHAQR